MASVPEPAVETQTPPDLAALLESVRLHHPEDDLRTVERAYQVAAQAHIGQVRVSGDPYISHPVAVAQIVADLRMDIDSVVASLLHDVVEDTSVSIESIALEFGAEVAHLVEGVTKLKMNNQAGESPSQRAAAETTRAAESLRKMLLAMAQDIRVMVIKLADRLHNMRTVGSLPPEKQTRIANETLDIYAPLAARLGIWQVKWQLEDLAFKALHPKEFAEISELVAKSRTTREDELHRATEQLQEQLVERGLGHAVITSRPKHLFSIFNKIVKQGFQFEEIYDLQAMRVLVNEPYECYLVLGLVHDLWLPMPGLFTDFIAMPKPNGYQSLHTKVIGPGGEPLEIQIRTHEMHEIAEFGVAAHWTYKEGNTKDDVAALSDLRKQLFDWSSDSRTSSDFLRTVTTDLFSEQVFVFTPKGDVLDLPRDSTPVDFAFRVHSDIGLRLVGAKVNGTMVPLHHRLQNGDVVELITRSNAQPSLDWLEFIKSQHTRSKLRAYFRRRNRSESVARGREAVDRGLKAAGIDPRLWLGDDRLNDLAKEFKDCEKGEDVLARVGEGLVSVQSFVEKVRKVFKDQQPELGIKTRAAAREATLIEGGIDNVMYRRAKCCLPVPGEDVVGYVARARGIVIHRRVCPNAMRLMETEAERTIPLDWPEDGAAHSVLLKIVAVNRQGLLMDISTILGETKTNVSGLEVRTLPNHTAEMDLTIDVTDTTHLQSVMNKIGNFSDVISILRVFDQKTPQKS
ncbi:MAG: bifunctional (p)ppGpp synthetase/guanosine-3',5'-bis(diphosphate) 3'-pyrophosphohydrolase [Fimbriimonadaceae bacterium]|nr:bifunctional (p)ppGpp synthetase/guanosine-3',5'-bis(diphosphate) 3'-pyrophosphohydrolase [Fimbriimonadaceae bacterium]QYK59343.1 MAG: bifunctional (p)ppGpp synthetase/guanosine-3',5'-bis(diphosphate) 3'-pyrophosphohydrolase [Fimbriimonadaceae bacterium]